MVSPPSASVDSGQPSQLLLVTKLHVPPARPGLIPRPRLLELMNHGLACRLVLISAPPGFGKTTLVAEWIASLVSQAARPGLAWLSLDEGDSDPARFFNYLLAALQQVDPAIGQAARKMLSSPQPPPSEAILTSLINDLAAVPAPFILVLDDYHLISALPIHQQLAFLLEHQPPQMHLVIITRQDPPWPLARLRARRQVIEIRQADLQFTAQETADFIHAVAQVEIAPGEVAVLQQRTEGWIAGLQLFALSLRGQDDVKGLVESFTGSQRYVLDYMADEVFQRQSAEVQAFLLQTSILDRLTAPLCDAVAGRADSRQVLMTLEQANLFVIPLDQSREWYRYHHLFADLLRHRLQVQGSYDVAQLHNRACRWLGEHGWPAEAIRHALSARDWDEAAVLLVRHSGELLNRGEVVTLLGWFRAMPEDYLRARPELCYQYSWPLLLAEQIDAAESFLSVAEQAAQGNPAFLGEVAAAQAHAARVRGDGRRVIELSEKALALLPLDNSGGRSVVALNLGLAYYYAGLFDRSEHALAQARQAAQQSGNHYVETAARVFDCKIQAARAKLHRAIAAYQETIQQGEQLPIVALAHSDLARLLYEQDDLPAAAGHAQQAIEASQRIASPEQQLAAFRTLALIKQAQGESAAAKDALQTARRLIQHPGISPSARLHALAYQILMSLADGDLDQAARLVEQSPPLEDVKTLPDYALLSQARARLLLGQNRRADAAQLLEQRYEKTARAGMGWARLETRALQALAARTSGEAFDFLAESLTLGEPEGYIRTFVDLGAPMQALLSGYRALRGKRSRAAHFCAAHLRAESKQQMDYVDRLLAAFAAQPAAPAPQPSARELQPALAEPLSERELTVLRLMATGLSNREIAEKLVISPGTAKSHVNHICGKLGVRNRTEAAMRARELGLA